ncbi:MAG TPA: type VII toxin-antitoxin system MntA family adenylyltransferase antitoxin [Candidatus Wujingus californicus]|uniref:type VII toxin-antitoxin system MntA family adenylyltransferase antitoxin n=1 Tax=Candidatus Wujingus californicus TaxID=3367618 RepID=UPI004027DB21
MAEKNIKVDTMIKFDRLPENINKLLPKAKEYLNTHPKVVFAYLFGSIAKDKLSPLSDVDIAIYLSEESDIAQEKMETLGKLMELLETDEIDLIILNTASLPLAARIIENKVILVDKKPFLRHTFESLILREYFDFSRKEMDILERRYIVGRQTSHTEKIK